MKLFPNMDTETAARVGKLFAKAGRHPSSLVDPMESTEAQWEGRNDSPGGGFILKFKTSMVHKASLVSDDRHAASLHAIHGTNVQGACGVIAELKMRGSHTLHNRGVWCLAQPWCSTKEDREALAHRVSKHRPQPVRGDGRLHCLRGVERLSLIHI